MNALRAAPGSTLAPVGAARVPMIGVLRALLLSEAAGGLVLAIFLSLLAGAQADVVNEIPLLPPLSQGDTSNRAEEETLRFAAGGAFVFAIAAAVASRGARRRRPSAWTLAAILQVIVAVATGAAVIIVEWHPLFLVGFAFAAVVMLVLSTTSVRRALDQD